MKSHILTILVLVAAVGCSKGEDSASSEDEGKPPAAAAGKAPTTDKAPTAINSASDDPCEILTEAVVRKHFKLAKDIEVSHKLSTPGGNGHCGYHWSTLTPEEEAEKNKKMAEAAMARARNRGKGKDTAQTIADITMHANYGRGSAHLTMTKKMASEQAAVSALDSSRDYLEKRAKAKAAKDEVDFTSQRTDVAGVGSKAYYAEKMRQLSLAYGTRLYHLGATPDREGNSLEIATAIAKEIFP